MTAKIIALSLIAAFLGAILSEMGCKSKKAVVAVFCIVIFLGIVGEVSGLFSELLSLGEQSEIASLAKCALKIIGLGYVFGISADICEELSENRIASLLTLFSRIEMLLVTLPYIREMIQMGIRLIK